MNVDYCKCNFTLVHIHLLLNPLITHITVMTKTESDAAPGFKRKSWICRLLISISGEYLFGQINMLFHPAMLVLTDVSLSVGRFKVLLTNFNACPVFI